jgi:CheY-like chemotaxis protein
MLERVKFLTQRIRKILEASKICVVETDNENTLLSSLSDVNQNISLVLLDLDLEQRYAMDLLIETRRRLRTTPIIIMTSETKKPFFVEAMLQGATDFIIKPFTDQFFAEKIQKCLEAPNLPSRGFASSESDIVTMDLNQYIKGELRKAEKGNFPLSLMFMYFENNSPDKLRERETNNFIFNFMKKQFWDTDLFIRFASEHGLGIFPFCNDKNTVIIKTKIELKFEELKKANESLKDYNMICAFISYPYDTTEINKVFSLFIGRINAKFQNLRLQAPKTL